MSANEALTILWELILQKTWTDVVLILIFSLLFFGAYYKALHKKPYEEKIKDEISSKTEPLKEDIKKLKAVIQDRDNKIEKLKEKNYQLQLEKVTYMATEKAHVAKYEAFKDATVTNLANLKQYSKEKNHG